MIIGGKLSTKKMEWNSSLGTGNDDVNIGYDGLVEAILHRACTDVVNMYVTARTVYRLNTIDDIKKNTKIIKLKSNSKLLVKGKNCTRHFIKSRIECGLDAYDFISGPDWALYAPNLDPELILNRLSVMADIEIAYTKMHDIYAKCKKEKKSFMEDLRSFTKLKRKFEKLEPYNSDQVERVNTWYEKIEKWMEVTAS